MGSVEILAPPIGQERIRAPHRSQPPKNARQLKRGRAANPEHVDWLRVIAKRHRAAVARSP